MTKQLWRIACGPDCGFLVRSHDKDEVARAGAAHAKNLHGKAMTHDEAIKILEPVNLPKAT